MPHIIVIGETPAEDGAVHVMLRERVTERDFESGHFATQLVERLGSAVGDARAVDDRASRATAPPRHRATAPPAPPRHPRHPRPPEVLLRKRVTGAPPGS